MLVIENLKESLKVVSKKAKQAQMEYATSCEYFYNWRCEENEKQLQKDLQNWIKLENQKTELKIAIKKLEKLYNELENTNKNYNFLMKSFNDYTKQYEKISFNILDKINENQKYGDEIAKKIWDIEKYLY